MSVAALLLAFVVPQSPADIAGLWKTHDGKALVRVAPCGRKWCGTIVRLLTPPPAGHTHDVENPDPAKRSRAILGLPVLVDFTRDGDLWRGEIYDPEHGKTYRSTLQRKSGMLEVKGCISIFCKTKRWPAAG